MTPTANILHKALDDLLDAQIEIQILLENNLRLKKELEETKKDRDAWASAAAKRKTLSRFR